MSASARCPNADYLRQLLDGQLDDALCQSLEEHLEHCSSCLTLMRQIESTDSLPQALERSPAALMASLRDMDLTTLAERFKALRPADGVTVPAEVSPDSCSTSNLQAPVGPALAAANQRREEEETAGMKIGAYKLLQKLGKGGMGVVWMADQTEPVSRRVAIKIIKADLRGDQVLARFEAERQALAMMDHPNIARVLDAGATSAGRPYFVMELVKGIPFNSYCDQEHLTPKERLELFIPVCNAVQHAHQKGIIHRDLKPSNVLIALYDGKPVPKVIDFGVAKAAHLKLTEKTMFTEVGQMVGTLEYMAPEQAEMNNLDIDTRADIYSLGVMLYELLTGTLPFTGQQLRGAAYLEMLRIIREVEPQKPSTKISSSAELPAIADKRQLEPARLSRFVKGDLDWIVMKCLEKERARRYETANQLGQELQRFLADEPVQAGPPSVAYRAKKFLRRNKGPVIAAGLVVLALVAGIISTGIGMVAAERAAEEARRARDVAEKATAAEKKTAEENKILALRAEEGRLRAEKMALQARFDQAFFRSRDEPAVAMVSAAPLLPEVLSLNDSVLADSIKLHLGAWSQEVHEMRVAWSYQHEGKALAFSLDGKKMATGGKDMRARLWDVATGRQLEHNMKHQGEVLAVAFSADAQTVVTGSKDKTARIWDVATGKQIGPDMNHEFPVVAVAISKDNKTVLTGTEDKIARQWKAETGKQFGLPMEHEKKVVAVAYSPDGKTVLTGSHDRTARLWDAATGKLLRSLAHPAEVLAVAFNREGDTLLTGCVDSRARLWETATGKPIGPPLKHVAVWYLAFSPDGKTVLTGSHNSALLWDVDTAQQIGPPMQHRETLVAVAFGEDNHTLLTAGSTDNTVRIWGAASTVKKLKVSLKPRHSVYAAMFSPDGNTVLTGGGSFKNGGEALLWDASTGKQLLPAMQHKDVIRSVTFSADGKTFLSASIDGTAQLWETATGKQLGSSIQHPDEGGAVAFSPDGKTVLTGGKDNTALLWNVANRKQFGQPLRHKDKVRDAAFSPDGKTVLTGGHDNHARFWDAATGMQLEPPIRHEHFVLAVAFSRDGKSVLTGSGSTARLWDVATRKQVGPPLQHQHFVFALAFSPDGRTVLTASSDDSARLWEAATGKQLGPPMVHPSGVFAVAFSPDSKSMLTGGQKGTARLWRLPPPIRGEPERILLWSQVLTGLELDEHGLVRILDAASWHKRRQRLQELGASPVE